MHSSYNCTFFYCIIWIDPRVIAWTKHWYRPCVSVHRCIVIFLDRSLADVPIKTIDVSIVKPSPTINSKWFIIQTYTIKSKRVKWRRSFNCHRVVCTPSPSIAVHFDKDIRLICIGLIHLIASLGLAINSARGQAEKRTTNDEVISYKESDWAKLPALGVPADTARKPTVARNYLLSLMFTNWALIGVKCFGGKTLKYIPR